MFDYQRGIWAICQCPAQWWYGLVWNWKWGTIRSVNNWVNIATRNCQFWKYFQRRKLIFHGYVELNYQRVYTIPQFSFDGNDDNSPLELGGGPILQSVFGRDSSICLRNVLRYPAQTVSNPHMISEYRWWNIPWPKLVSMTLSPNWCSLVTWVPLN